MLKAEKRERKRNHVHKMRKDDYSKKPKNRKINKRERDEEE